MTKRQQDIKHLGLRVPVSLWTRTKDAAWSAKVSIQAYCVAAIEQRVIRDERKSGSHDEVNGKSVRAKLPAIRKSNPSGNY